MNDNTKAAKEIIELFWASKPCADWVSIRDFLDRHDAELRAKHGACFVDQKEKVSDLEAKINELVAHNEKIYEAIRKMKEADIGHARVCPQHVKNIDPWVRESALIAANAEVSSLKSALAKARAEGWNKAARKVEDICSEFGHDPKACLGILGEQFEARSEAGGEGGV